MRVYENPYQQDGRANQILSEIVKCMPEAFAGAVAVEPAESEEKASLTVECADCGPVQTYRLFRFRHGAAILRPVFRIRSSVSLPPSQIIKHASSQITGGWLRLFHQTVRFLKLLAGFTKTSLPQQRLAKTGVIQLSCAAAGW